ncbi:MAG TPA: cell division protein ZapA [Chitinophagaceae bacterium]|nr:cell division protein ZapA [Chitinophagaceae bacterium]
MAELIPVNILIADRTYRIKIEPADEEKLRKTVKFINDKILEFKTAFAGKDMQDYIAMALLWFATERNENGQDKIVMQELAEKMLAMEGQIDRTLTELAKS